MHILVNEQYSFVTPNQNMKTMAESMTSSPTDISTSDILRHSVLENYWISVNKWKNNKQGCCNLHNIHSPYEVSLDLEHPEDTPASISRGGV